MNIRSIISAGLMIPTMSACVGTYHVSPDYYLQQNRPAEMVVVDSVGAFHVINNPSMSGDTVVGIERGTPDTIALPMSEIEDALVRHHSTARTVLLVGAVTGVAGLAVLGMAVNGHGTPCVRGPRGNKDAIEGTGTEGC